MPLQRGAEFVRRRFHVARELEELLHFRGGVIVNLDEVFVSHGAQILSTPLNCGRMAYQVPMIEVAVVVALAGLDPEEHFLYLAPFSDRRDGPESVADYLNGRRRFFPMVAGGVAKMVNRDQVLWVRYEKLPSVVDPEGRS